MADRPLECSHCKKPINVEYKEITEDSTVASSMCSDCPVLMRKLHGEISEERAAKGWDQQQAGVCCGTCGTNLEWIKMGNQLGCKECYNVFSDVIQNDLMETGKVPARLNKTIKMKSHLPLHIGKSPLEEADIAPSEQLTSLNEALKEALKKENYEQAAWLRDQIKSLLEKRDNGKS